MLTVTLLIEQFPQNVECSGTVLVNGESLSLSESAVAAGEMIALGLRAHIVTSQSFDIAQPYHNHVMITNPATKTVNTILCRSALLRHLYIELQLRFLYRLYDFHWQLPLHRSTQAFG